MIQEMSTPNLAIFNAAKRSGNSLTKGAVRQRSIIFTMTGQLNPTERTRAAISKRIAVTQEIDWKKIYPGVFKDFDDVLIPLDLVREEGRLPLKHGPKLLQDAGTPYYSLTARGLVVSLALEEVTEKEEILKRFFESTKQDDDVEKNITGLIKMAPRLAYFLLEKYVRAYCNGKVDDLVPLDFEGLKIISDDSTMILKEFLESFVNGTDEDRRVMMDALRLM